MAQRATGIGTKIGVGFGAPLLLLVGVSVFAWRASATQLESSRWVAHTHRVLAQLEELLSLINVQSGGRGFAITGEERFLEPTTVARAALPERVTALRALMRDNPRQLARLEALEPPLAGLIAYNERLVDARREGGAETASEVLPLGRLAGRIIDLAGGS